MYLSTCRTVIKFDINQKVARRQCIITLSSKYYWAALYASMLRVSLTCLQKSSPSRVFCRLSALVWTGAFRELSEAQTPSLAFSCLLRRVHLALRFTQSDGQDPDVAA